ncbi:sigma-70 family RNA polymerase sigma factor [Catenulispora rubra]|uniref:sigma-70 family RNA polymerase sigma factor n=1 Tax=Catenulispora rubra TaxID=280293 RepID=UPI0018927597|nr:sigma-70 family RNA polymerase sigma factor [Catenulispora rubra]
MYTSDVRVDPRQAAAEGIEVFQSVRPRLFRIAYRMLGRVADAEDVVQDVWVRWQGTNRAGVNDRVAFLVTITTNAALNVAVSARFRREIPVGRHVAERTPADEDPTLRAERWEEVENAVRLLVQRLSPAERAVFVLREAFGYRFAEIAEILVLNNSNVRQLAHRARARLAERRREPAPAVTCDRLLKAFLAAAQDGAVADLEQVLIDDVIAHYKRKVSPAPVAAGCLDRARAA